MYIYADLVFVELAIGQETGGWVVRQIAWKITISREQRCYGLNFLTFVCIYPRDKRYSFPPKKTGYNVKLFFCCLRVSPFCIIAGVFYFFFLYRAERYALSLVSTSTWWHKTNRVDRRSPLLLSCNLT